MWRSGTESVCSELWITETPLNPNKYYAVEIVSGLYDPETGLVNRWVDSMLFDEDEDPIEVEIA